MKAVIPAAWRDNVLEASGPPFADLDPGTPEALARRRDLTLELVRDSPEWARDRLLEYQGTLPQAKQRGDRWRSLALVSFVVAGISAVTAIAGWARALTEPARTDSAPRQPNKPRPRK